MVRPRKEVSVVELEEATERIDSETENAGQKLDRTCLVLMEFLPKETCERILEAKDGLGLPLWHMILGYVMRCRDREEIWSPHTLSMWENGLPADAPRPCSNCGKTFTSKYAEAAYCCETCAFDKVQELGHRPDCPTRTFKGVAA